MKSNLLATTLVVALMSVATPAMAQDDNAFDGAWVGATGGYDGFDAGADTDAEDGFVYGIALGYDFDLGGVLVGAEIEATDSSVKATAADILEDGDELSLSVGRDLYAGVRIGVPLSDTVLAYAKAGYTNQRFSASYTFDDETMSVSENMDGYRLGAGVELDLGAPFGRIEYRYSGYGRFSDADLETSRHQLMLTAGMRF
ncbi:outer membrane beta-barrel protein [Altererythrobacter arenosus]|uniref:Outer membrane beta-barrel protein n=1 Tax=Altererythrobacter arenosus TaxID=3032592 RepID=A0ABY8FMA5_9SPHN|nr:outer membrane beta-barrel protein [Altererythrobacter sp. CAU 1644]WFL76133.1 outer membrane beta-barrel protein [Altererythrobacter sp. CAU 1644]